MSEPTPQTRVSHLLRYPDRELTPATVRIHFPCEELARVEELWGPTRQQREALLAEIQQRIASDMRTTRNEEVGDVIGRHILQHGHWNWHRKVEFVNDGTLMLIAVECEEQVQGLMAIAKRQRRSRDTAFGDQFEQPLLYVEYVETAPWNLSRPGLPLPRFGSVGTVLIGEAIRLSFASGCEGRIGLHSLPQAERFYRNRCAMTLVAWDEDYYGLSYFELSKRAAANWLELRGLSDE